LQRLRRGIYRIARFPPTENEDLIVIWLWSRRDGVFSHDTALSLHQLSDALPTRYHITVPTASPPRRARSRPRNVVHRSRARWTRSGELGSLGAGVGVISARDPR
jgi:predicted transcriptional regulator of viral defense system